LMFMGVRAFNPVTGQFLSQDPVPGGNETAYNYPNDPINGSDLTGTWGWGEIDWIATAINVATNLAISAVAGAFVAAICAASVGLGCLISGMVLYGIGGLLAGAIEADRMGLKGTDRSNYAIQNSGIWAVSAGVGRYASDVKISGLLKKPTQVSKMVEGHKFRSMAYKASHFILPNTATKLGFALIRKLIAMQSG